MSEDTTALLLPHITCQRQRANLRLGYPKTCQQCVLFGPCPVYDGKPVSRTVSPVQTLDISGLEFSMAEVNCEEGDC